MGPNKKYISRFKYNKKSNFFVYNFLFFILKSLRPTFGIWIPPVHIHITEQRKDIASAVEPY
jgi:hypothetical protein